MELSENPLFFRFVHKRLTDRGLGFRFLGGYWRVAGQADALSRSIGGFELGRTDSAQERFPVSG